MRLGSSNTSGSSNSSSRHYRQYPQQQRQPKSMLPLQWIRLWMCLCLLPAFGVYWHFSHVWKYNQCLFIGPKNNATVVDLYCVPPTQSYANVMTLSKLDTTFPPPTITKLSTMLEMTKTTTPLTTMAMSQLQSLGISWDGLYWKESNPNDNIRIWNGAPAPTLTSTALDFKQNKKQHKELFPIATWFWFGLNVGLFVWYWNDRIDSSVVSLKFPLVDLGRGISGHLAHFELYHIGFNMMSCQSLGMALENLKGSSSLFFLTWSLIPMTTLIIYSVLLPLKQRLFPTSTSQSHMVGFSGILFAWMVLLVTLQGREQQQQQHRQDCPIFFMPDVCFEPWNLHIFGTTSIPISLGPWIQLLLIQMMLPKRASFMGHLAGIISGLILAIVIIVFPTIWLEWMQPSILWTVLWAYAQQIPTHLFHVLRRDSTHTTQTLESPSSSTSNITTTQQQQQQQASLGGWIWRWWLIHWIMTLVYYACFGGLNTTYLVTSSSDLVGQFFLMIVLVLFVHSIAKSSPTTSRRTTRLNDNEYHDSGHIIMGMLGRGYCVLVVVVLLTESMTLGGWAVTWSVLVTPQNQSQMIGAVLCKVANNVFLWLSLCHVSHVLGSQEQLINSGTFMVMIRFIVSRGPTALGAFLQESYNNSHHFAQQTPPHGIRSFLPNMIMRMITTRRKDKSSSSDHHDKNDQEEMKELIPRHHTTTTTTMTPTLDRPLETSIV